MDSLSQSINKVSEIDKKIIQIDKKKPENKFTDNMTSLSQPSDKVSEIDRKISTHISYVIKILINLIYYYEKVFIPMNTWMAGINLMNLYHW